MIPKSALILQERVGTGKSLAKCVSPFWNTLSADFMSDDCGETYGALDFKHALLNLENRDIEGTTAEIVDRDDTISFLVKAVGEGCRCRFVDDTEDVQTSDLACIFGGLTL
jgi:hypothetical protein